MKASVLALTLSLFSCMMLDWIMPASKGISVDTEVVVGYKHEEIATGAVVGKKETTNNTAENITQAITTVNEANPTIPWLVAMLCLMLPTPTRMWMGIMNLFKRKRNA